MKPGHSASSTVPNTPCLAARQTGFLPGAKRKATTRDEFIHWAKSPEMRPVFDRLAQEAVRMKQYLGADHVIGKRALWVLLTMEAVCRQERNFLVEPLCESEVLEGIQIVGELLLAAARVDNRPEPLKDPEFWSDFHLNICIAWGAPATEIKLDPRKFYSIQLRRRAS